MRKKLISSNNINTKLENKSKEFNKLSLIYIEFIYIFVYIYIDKIDNKKNDQHELKQMRSLRANCLSC